MKIISSTGGSGSSFVAEQFKRMGWYVCLRPDGGKQKSTHTVEQIYTERTHPFYDSNIEGKQNTQKDLFNMAYEGLNGFSPPNLMLLCMSWGGMGFLNDLPEKTIFILRDPVFAYNSYSGGGWRKEGGQRRIKHVGASGPNDKVWIDAFLGDFSMWIDGAKNALQAHNAGTGHIVRYHKFAEDWKKIDNVPPIYQGFSAKDREEKLEGFLTEETIKYIREKTNDIWLAIDGL